MLSKKPETLAWLVTLTAFFICIALAIGIPTTTRWYILNATHPLERELDPQGELVQGGITYQSGGHGNPIVATASLNNDTLPTGSSITLADNAEALLIFSAHATDDNPVGTIQLYGGTNVILQDTMTPNFAPSLLPHQIGLKINRGRARFSIGGDARATRALIRTPHGEFTLDEGTYTVIVTAADTQVMVSTGLAHIPVANGENFILTPLQRVELTAAGVSEIAVGGRNLLRNSSFDEGIDQSWKAYTRDVQFSNESGGDVTLFGTERKIVIFKRIGRGHAETGIEQEVNQNIRGVQSLQVSARLRVETQDLPVCGMLGTECPLMLRIVFTDLTGNSHEWLQGFYADIGSAEEYPDRCIQCESNPQHVRVPKNVWYPYQSPNLIPLLKAQGMEPATIQKITIYASGHTYTAALSDISILVED